MQFQKVLLFCLGIVFVAVAQQFSQNGSAAFDINDGQLSSLVFDETSQKAFISTTQGSVIIADFASFPPSSSTQTISNGSDILVAKFGNELLFSEKNPTGTEIPVLTTGLTGTSPITKFNVISVGTSPNVQHFGANSTHFFVVFSVSSFHSMAACVSGPTCTNIYEVFESNAKIVFAAFDEARSIALFVDDAGTIFKSNALNNLPNGFGIALPGLSSVSTGLKYVAGAYDSASGMLYLAADNGTSPMNIAAVVATTLTVRAFTLDQGFSSPATVAYDRVSGKLLVGVDSLQSSGIAIQVSVSPLPSGNTLTTLAVPGVDKKMVASFVDSGKFGYLISTLNITRFVLTPCSQTNCNGRGSCVQGACACVAPPPVTFPNSTWTGDCDVLTCYQNCNPANGGLCNNGTCDCSQNEGFTGVSCAEKQCGFGNNCHNSGTCSGFPDFICTCDAGRTGKFCELERKDCSVFDSCDSCTSNSSCVWCVTSGTCMEGTVEGPTSQFCADWSHETCPQIGMEIWAYIFSAIAGIFIVVDITSVIMEDRKIGPKSRLNHLMISRMWWRNQRAAKLWLFLEQIQFSALSVQFAVGLPTLYTKFASIFRWSIFGFELPWNQTTSLFPTSSARSLLNYTQYINLLAARRTDYLISSLFWFVILLVVVMVFFGIFFVITITCCQSSLHYWNLRDFMKNRFFYAFFRVVHFAYFPFASFCGYALLHATESSLQTAIAIVVLVIIHIAFAVGIFIYVRPDQDQEEKLFQLDNFRKIGFTYFAYVTPRNYFFLVSLGRRLLFGLLLGFLAEKNIVQLVVCAAIEIIYLGVVAYLKPHLDVMQFFTEAACAACNAAVLLISIAFLQSIPIQLQGKIIATAFMTAILLVAQIVCIATYIISWLRIYRVFSFKEFINLLRGKHGDNVNLDHLELDQVSKFQNNSNTKDS